MSDLRMSWVEPLLLPATAFYLASYAPNEYFKGLSGSQTPSSDFQTFVGRDTRTLAVAVKIKRLSRRMIRGGLARKRLCGLQLEREKTRRKK